MSIRIVNNPKTIKTGHVLAIGNFDGVHKGHKALITKAAQIAREKGLKTSVITFEPHPVHLFAPQKKPLRITSLRGKTCLLEKLGVEICYILKFNRHLAAMPAAEFINNYLAGSHVVTGHDFSFGKARLGSTQTLADALGANYTCLDAVSDEAGAFSSTRIREYIKAGDVTTAANLLGHNYFIEGRIRRGAGVGSKLGFATANIGLKSHILKPKYGVYAVETNFGSGVANFGVRPTVDGLTELFEVHLFNFKQDIYGQEMVAELTRYIRPEMKFENVDALKKQIEADIKAVINSAC